MEPESGSSPSHSCHLRRDSRVFTGVLLVIVSLCEQSENVCEDILKLGHGVSAVEIDLMEPIDPQKTPR